MQDTGHHIQSRHTANDFGALISISRDAGSNRSGLGSVDWGIYTHTYQMLCAFDKAVPRVLHLLKVL